MRLTLHRGLAIGAMLLTVIALRGHDASSAMATAAQNFLTALDPAQRTRTTFPLTAPERLHWSFVPAKRLGLPLKDMTPGQQALARALLRSGLSQRGSLQAETIITLENVLREMEHDPLRRDPTLYYVTLFGEPAHPPWGWRFEGHHLSLNFTIPDAEHIVVTPSFFGTNPAEVRTGPLLGTRVLAAEEDLALEFVNSLDATQRASAVIAATAPRDIATGNRVRVEPLAPLGLAATALTPTQRQQLRALLQLYFDRYRTAIAAPALATADLEGIHFAWAGVLDRSAGHYYRIQGKTFVVEFDNTQNNANHIHTVWRNFTGDFARDLLAEHYAHDHAPSTLHNGGAKN